MDLNEATLVIILDLMRMMMKNDTKLKTAFDNKDIDAIRNDFKNNRIYSGDGEIERLLTLYHNYKKDIIQ